jgi:hypothetical protein
MTTFGPPGGRSAAAMCSHLSGSRTKASPSSARVLSRPGEVHHARGENRCAASGEAGLIGHVPPHHDGPGRDAATRLCRQAASVPRTVECPTERKCPRTAQCAASSDARGQPT